MEVLTAISPGPLTGGILDRSMPDRAKSPGKTANQTQVHPHFPAGSLLGEISRMQTSGIENLKNLGNSRFKPFILRISGVGGDPTGGLKGMQNFGSIAPTDSKIFQNSTTLPYRIRVQIHRMCQATGRHVPGAVLAHTSEVSPTHNAVLGCGFGQLHIAIVPISQFCSSFDNLIGFRIQG